MSIDAISFDWDEELRSRRLNAIAEASHALSLQPILKQPTGHSTVSTISKVQEAETGISRLRPQLEQPMCGPLRVHQRLEQLGGKQSRIFETQVNDDMAEIERLDAEKIEKLRKQAESIKSQKTWNVVSTVAQCVMSGSVIALAAVIASVAPVAAGVLFASATLSMAGIVLRDTGAIQSIAAYFAKTEELQKKIATRIEMGMFFLSFGLGLSGGAWAHSLGAFGNAANHAINLKKIVEGIGLGAGIGKASSDFGNSFLKKRTSHLEAEIQEIETKSNELYQNLYQNARDVQNFIDTTGDIGDEVKQLISATRVDPD